MQLNKETLNSVIDEFVKTESASRFSESSTMVIGEFKKGNYEYQLQVTLTRCEDDFDELGCQNVFDQSGTSARSLPKYRL
jgi:hypothetical protein